MEEKVAETLLEEKKEIVIGGEVYLMRPPSIATLVLASKYIGQLPIDKMDSKHIVSEIIKHSENLVPIGNAISAMILGARGYNEIANPTLNYFTRKGITKGSLLADKIIHEDINVILKHFIAIINLMNISAFFQLTTFLIELNITKRTRRVVN